MNSTFGTSLGDLLTAAGWTQEKIPVEPAVKQLQKITVVTDKNIPLNTNITSPPKTKPALRLGKGGILLVTGGRLSRSSFFGCGVGRVVSRS